MIVRIVIGAVAALVTVIVLQAVQDSLGMTALWIAIGVAVVGLALFVFSRRP